MHIMVQFAQKRKLTRMLSLKRKKIEMENFELRHDIMRQHVRALSESQQEKVKIIKEKGQDFFDFLDLFPSDRETSIAKTKIEEAVMWAVKGFTK